MDGRKGLLLTLGLLVGLSGCQHPFGGLHVATNDGGASGEQGPMKHRPETYVAFGDLRARSALLPEAPAAQKAQLREEARLAYQQALAVDPNYRPAYLALARLFDALEDQPKTIGYYRRALQLGEKDAPLWYELGMYQARHKEWAGAIESLTRASELDPDNKQYATNLGFALARAERFQESFAVLARIGGEAKAHYNLARMLQYMNQPALARKHLEMAVLKDPNLVAARALLDNPNPSGAGVRQAGYTEGDAGDPGQPGSAPQGSPPGPAGARPIRIPPPPVIPVSLHPEGGPPKGP